MAAAIVVFLILFYIFCILPRLLHRPDYEPFRGWHYAHRGLHDNEGTAPENSLPAFRMAVEEGYGIELDVQLTKDKVPVVFHDDWLKRVTGAEGRVWDMDFEELRRLRICGSKEKIPTLQETLELVDGKVPLIVEFKMHNTDPEVCRVADPLLRNYRGLYCMESFVPFAVAWYRKHRPEIVRGQLSSNFRTTERRENVFEFTVHHLLTNLLCRPDFIAYDWRYTDNFSRTACRKIFHALSVSWTIRSEKELERFEDDYDLFIFEGFRPEGRGLAE